MFDRSVTIFSDDIDKLIAGLEGIQFPKGTKTIEWKAHGVKTLLPFTGSTGNLDWVCNLMNSLFSLTVIIYVFFFRMLRL
jgi:hypothetical protein